MVNSNSTQSDFCQVDLHSFLKELSRIGNSYVSTDSEPALNYVEGRQKECK